MFAARRWRGAPKAAPIDRSRQESLADAAARPAGARRLHPAMRVWMMALRGYLFLAGGLVIARIIELALTGAS